ncbi:MAG: AMP-dependent synthetase/ligase [Antricoccus sp.]
MLEISVPAEFEVPDKANVADLVFDNAANFPQDGCIRLRAGSTWTDLSSADFASQVRALAKGFIAAGYAAGERIAIMSSTRFEWTLCDYALSTAGIVVVPIYETSSAEQVEWILADSAARAVIVETAGNSSVVEGLRDQLAELQDVWSIEAGDIEALTKRGADISDDEVDTRRHATQSTDLATIVYTSGTTGRPKGCQLTHRNIIFDAQNTLCSVGDIFVPGTSTLLFLPLAHVLARMIQHAAILARVRLGHSNDIANLLPDLESFTPSFLLAVPRVFEKVYNSAAAKAAAEGKGKIFAVAAKTAIDYSKALDAGSPSIGLRLRRAIFDKLVYGRLRAALGGQCSSAVSGGGPLGERLGHFFRGIGITIYEGYGLTETSPVTSMNNKQALRIGSVGQPIPGASFRIAQDGELLIKGEHVFGGYWKNEQATAEVLVDGWLHTGDVGAIDRDGFLRITGRKKEIIVTAGGKNVAPAVLEDRLRANALVSQCIVVGDGKPFIGALLTLDEEALPGWLSSHSKPADLSGAQLAQDADVHAAIQEAVDEANKAVSKAESIRKFVILDHDLTEANGYLTPSMKIRRRNVQDDYAAKIEQIYTS